MNKNVLALKLATLFGLAWFCTSNYSALAQSAATGTTITMAKGSQSADNPEFYVPSETTTEVGDSVTWKNDDTAIHTATSGKDATPDGNFDTSLVPPGQSSKPIEMPNEPGQYVYFCTLHPWMEGSITVN